MAERRSTSRRRDREEPTRTEQPDRADGTPRRSYPDVTEGDNRSNGLLSAAEQRPYPPIPAVRTTPAMMQQEYVAGTRELWWPTLARALPWSIDDVTADFGDDVYERMALDAEVAKDLTIFKAAILEDGLQLLPAIEEKDDPAYDDATAIRDEAETMLDQMETSLDDVLWNMLDAQHLGNKIAEICMRTQTAYTMPRPLLQVVTIKPKPRHVVAFGVDAYLNVKGILAARPGFPLVLNGAFMDPEHEPPNLLSRQRFLVTQFRPRDMDPRGTSILRPAYDPWWRKRQVIMEYLKFLSRFASPSLWATTTPNATNDISAATDARGTVLYDQAGNLLTQVTTPEQRLLAQLLQFQNGTAMAVPAGTIINTIQATGEGRAFLAALDEANNEIRGSILTQRLATEEGESGNGARAAAQVHQDVLNTLVRQQKKQIARSFRQDVLRQWVLWNYGEPALKLVPKCSLGTTEEEDKGDVIRSFATAYPTGLIRPSQLPAVWEKMGLPIADLNAEDEEGGDLPPPPPPNPAAQKATMPNGEEPGGPNGRPQGANAPGTTTTTNPRQEAERAAGNEAKMSADAPAVVPAGAEAGSLGIGSGPVRYDRKTRSLVQKTWDAAMPRWKHLLMLGLLGWQEQASDHALSEEEQVALRDAFLVRQTGQMELLAQQLADQQITLRAWELAMRDEIQVDYAAQWTLATGRPLEELSGDEWQQIGTLVREQYRYLHRFAEAVRAGTMTETSIVHRANLYAHSAVTAYERGRAYGLRIELPAYPGDGSTPCLVNCFPGDTLVQGATVEKAYRRRYVGQVVRLRTRTGHQLTATPNHPILTRGGWQRAGDLAVGDDLVCGGLGYWAPRGGPHVHDRPTTIEQVFETLDVGASALERVMGATGDFHGDGTNSQIDVVDAARLLTGNAQTASAEPLGEFQFAGADLTDTSLCTASLDLVGVAPSAPRRMGSSSPSRTVLSPKQVQADAVSIRPAARHDAPVQEPIAYGATGDAEAVRESLLALTGQVGLDDIVSIERETFDGHVFNLQTGSGWYIANGIIVHNCRCHWEIRQLSDGGLEAAWQARDDDHTCQVCEERAHAWNPLVFAPRERDSKRVEMSADPNRSPTTAAAPLSFAALGAL